MGRRRHAVALLCALVPMATFGQAAMPAVAAADELEDLEHEVREVRDKISECQATRIESIRVQEEAERTLEEERAKLDEIQARLDAQQESLSQIVKMQYTMGDGTRMLDMITSSESFASLSESMDYLNGIETKKLNATAQVLELRDAQQDVLDQLEEDERAAREAAERADADEQAMRDRLEEMRPRINELLGEVKARLSGSTGNAQLQEALSFLENVEGISDTQAALVRSAYHTGYAGWKRCEAWVEYVYHNAGVSMGGYGSAYSDYEDNFVSDDWNTMPAGALAFGSGSSGPYSHVGICVFNGGGGPDTIYVMDNEGSRNSKAVTLTEWLKWQTTVSWNNGRSGWFGWGYPDGANLA